MAEEGTEEKAGKEEEAKPKEKEPMPDVDFRQAAKNAGYALVPEADLKGLRTDQETLKGLRSIFPEEARGKEGDFIRTLSERAGEVDTLQEQVKSVEELKTENETLKTQNSELARGKKLSDMWGHVNKISQLRNVRVHERFIDEQKLVDFPLEKHDLSKPEAVEKFTDAVWKEVLEPAHNDQQSVIEQVGGGSARREEPDGKGRKPKDDTDEKPEGLRAFGSLA